MYFSLRLRSCFPWSRQLRQLACGLAVVLGLGWGLHGPDALAQSLTPKEAPYEVWAANSLDLTAPLYNPAKAGWIKLGATNRTATFSGRYRYYLVLVKKQPLFLDAVQGSNGSYYEQGSLPTGNAVGNTQQYVKGAPDNQFLILDGRLGSSYVIFYNTSLTWSSLRCHVYTTPPGGSRFIGLSGDLTFGSHAVGETAQRTLTIANRGSGSLTVTGINYPAGFSGAWSGVVPAGKSQKVPVTFTPAGAPAYYGDLEVICDSTYGNRRLHVSGHTPGEAPYDVWAANSYNGNQISLLYNPGGLGWTKLGTGNRVTQFHGEYNYYLLVAKKTDVVFLDAVRTSSGSWFSGQVATGNTLGGGTITGAPDGTYGVLNGPASGGIYSPDPYGSFILFWNTKGWSNMTFHAYVRPPTRIIGLSGDLDFGAVTIGSNAVGTLRIANSGDAALNVSGLSSPHGFSGSWTGSIPAGAWQDVPVTFTPHTRTDRAGMLTVTSDATSGTNGIAVSGAGHWPPPLTQADTRLASALIVRPGQPHPFTPPPLTGVANPATCAWDFGDGGSAECSPGHAYTNCGLYTVTYQGTEGMASAETNFAVAVTCPLNITNRGARATARLLLAKPAGDSFSFTAYADLGPAFNPSNKTVTVSFGGAELAFVLNKTGRGISYPHSCQLKYSRTTGLWSVKVMGKAGQWRDTWGDYGLINATVPRPGAEVTVPIVVMVDDMAFHAEKPLRYTARAGKLGSAK